MAHARWELVPVGIDHQMRLRMRFDVKVHKPVDLRIAYVSSAFAPRTDEGQVYRFQLRMAVVAIAEFRDHTAPVLQVLAAIVIRFGVSGIPVAGRLAGGELIAVPRRQGRLAAGPEWLGRWILRAARVPALADRVVASLADHPELFKRLLEIATGERRPGDISIPELARLVV